MSLARTLVRLLLVSLAVLGAQAAAAKTLKIGITLHPYYSFVANIVGDRAEVIPLIDADANPHGYAPQPAHLTSAAEKSAEESAREPGPAIRAAEQMACRRRGACAIANSSNRAGGPSYSNLGSGGRFAGR